MKINLRVELSIENHKNLENVLKNIAAIPNVCLEKVYHSGVLYDTDLVALFESSEEKKE